MSTDTPAAPDGSTDPQQRSAPAGEDGYALLATLGILGVLAMLLPVFFVVAVQDLTEARRHLAGDAGDRAARAGVQAVAAQISVGSSAATPASTVPTAAIVAAGFTEQTGWTDPQAQYDWARAVLLAQPPSQTYVTPTGSYRVVRTTNSRAVYSLGWAPDGSPESGTLVMAEYALPVFQVEAALLTGTDLDVLGSFNTHDASGAQRAGVHTNGNQSGRAMSTARGIDGRVTAVGAAQLPGGVSGQGEMPIPVIDPRLLHTTYAMANVANWYDLCPDGRAHRPLPGAAPCAPGSPVVTPTPGNWAYSAATKTWSQTAPPVGVQGVFYVYRASAEIQYGGGGGTARQTVITESSDNLGSCPRADDGDITLKQATVEAFLPGLTLVSGRDVAMEAQSQAADGAVAAQESISMRTSSSDGISNGYAVAQNRCGGTNLVQGSRIDYEPHASPFVSARPRLTAEVVLTGN
ncbi:hypothetical protein CLV92_105112 [Kineococcus xinjiangensis]|uniref:Uncharacterized protein n=1 Tax=Kineococcus xinjiangensis TaxID=512762 RepID=A0A2S6IP27_9ACTN|nr:hypothetical protein [Kineococcus xinjiangensis]PPK96012.1 hypothetical protein CLV92_105112 [Kineococcus xinjiangensis]